MEPERCCAIVFSRKRSRTAFGRAIQDHVEMKANEQSAEWYGAQDNAAPADQFWLDGGYLPSQNDQSWREQEAMGFSVSHEDGFAVLPAEIADEEPIQQEQILEPENTGRGLKGVMFALFMVPVIAFVIVAFTAPGILKPDFWRAHWDAANSLLKPASTPAIAARTPVPTPLAAKAPPKPQPTLAAAPDLNTAPVAAPVINAATPNANAAPTAAQAANMIPDIAPTPRSQPTVRPAKHNTADDRDTGGFYAMVIGTDGTREYRYFPAKPSP
jgi:hypothetical protein